MNKRVNKNSFEGCNREFKIMKPDVVYCEQKCGEDGIYCYACTEKILGRLSHSRGKVKYD